MSYKVLIPQDISDTGKNFLREHGYELLITGRTELSDLCRDVRDCNAILARTCPYPAEVFCCAPKLKCIARHGSGYDNVDVEAASRAGVYVCTTPDAPVISVAEHTMLLILACARNLPHINTQTHNGNWSCRNEARGYELYGKILGIIGFGSIGRTVARMAHFGFGMRVLGYSRSMPSDKAFLAYAEHTSCLDEVLEQADILSVHLPSTPQTKGMFNKACFSKMKKGSIFINTSRGDIAAEADLYEALKSRHLHMAALDVFAQEPCTLSNPLLTLDNLIATPHNAALTYEAMDRMGLMAAEEIHRVLSGQEPRHPVNAKEFPHYF